MSKEKIKVYLYTRVSTTMQIDGYSLDAQKTKMKAFCDYNEYEIAGEYEDAGKSGKSIEGRIAFNQMMDDIKSGKDEVSYVLVFKLSRFGRNAADVLATLQVMQDFGVNLICVEDGIDSSKDAGKLMISVLSAVAEIERENIRVQTMEGRMQKAREGKWNGGFTVELFALLDVSNVISQLFFMGTAGWDMPIQNIKLIAVAPMNMLQAEIYEYAFVLLGAIGFAGIVMFISAAVKNNVLTLLLSLAVVYGPMMIAEYLPYGMQKALDLIPLVGSSTDIFRTNTFRILGKLIWSPYLLITIPVLIGILCMPFAIKSWSRRMKA